MNKYSPEEYRFYIECCDTSHRCWVWIWGTNSENEARFVLVEGYPRGLQARNGDAWPQMPSNVDRRCIDAKSQIVIDSRQATNVFMAKLFGAYLPPTPEQISRL